MLSIGEFSKICAVTTKTLRYYDDIGLIKPIYKSDETGYRYYDVAQLEKMLTVNRLKNYELSLEEITVILKDESEKSLLNAICSKEKELFAKIEMYNLLLLELQTEIKNLKEGKKFMSHLNNLEIKLVEKEPMNILYSRQKMTVKNFPEAYGKLLQRISAEGLTITGEPLSIYHDKEFNPEDTDIELAIPVKDIVSGTRDLAPGLCVFLQLNGPYAELPSCYARLVEFIENNNYEIAAPPFEVYMTDLDTPPNEHITEIYFPIKKK